MSSHVAVTRTSLRAYLSWAILSLLLGAWIIPLRTHIDRAPFPPSYSPMIDASFSAKAPTGCASANKTQYRGLLNLDTIRDDLLSEAPWAESHGGNHLSYLGAGMLYYSFAYAFRAKTIVCLGSGGGFVPRMLRQAQRDMELAGIPTEGRFETILIDAHLPEAGWGATFYADNPDSVMLRKFGNDIRYIFQKTDDAFEMLRDEKITIDYLHVDADHSHEQSLKDFENFVQLLNDGGVVSFHDTCYKPKKCRTGVHETIESVRSRLDTYGLQLIDAHYLYRGVAFAISRDKEDPIETPAGYRWNGCKNNVASLHKSNPGFTKKSTETGMLPELGDYFHCDKFNMTELICPPGRRRDVKGRCSLCVPGMVGPDCEQFVYPQLRSRSHAVDLAYLSQPEFLQRQHLMASWLAQQDSQHIFEIGGFVNPASNFVSHQGARSIVSVDPLIPKPQWTEQDVVPAVRWLPCRYEDVLDQSNAAILNLEIFDALVCLGCHDIFSDVSVFDTLFESFPSLKTMILEYHLETSDPLFNHILSKYDNSWEVAVDITLDSKRIQAQLPDAYSKQRMLLLTRRPTM